MASSTAIDPDVAFVTGIAHRLALSLATLVVDQTLPSESDVPFEPFTAAFAVDQRLGVSSFRDALRFDPTRRVEMRPASSFFERVITAAGDSGDRRGQQAFATLEVVMRGALRPLRQAYVRGDGVVTVPFFLFGRLDGGPLVGLRSVAIET